MTTFAQTAGKRALSALVTRQSMAPLVDLS